MRLFLLVAVTACAGSARTAPAQPAAPPAEPPAPAEPVEPAPAPAPSAPATPPPPPARPITIVAVGDMMLGTTYPSERLPPNDGAELLAGVRETLRAADIAFGNLEGPLFDGAGDGKCARMKTRKRARQTCYAFRMPTRYARHLVDAGFDLVSVANNHAWDFGAEGRESTMRALDEAGLAHSGAPGTVATTRAGNMRVGMVAFATANHSHNLNDIDAAVAAVRAADRDHDLVIVSFHGGAEGRRHQHVPDGPETFYGEDRGDLRRFSRAVIDAGADLVIGHGPHVMRGLEVYNDRLIAYSLGNFATYYGISVKGLAGVAAMLEVTLDPEGRFVSGRLHPVMQKRPRGPMPDPEARAIGIVQKLSADDFPDTAPVIGDDGTLSPPQR